MEHEIPPFLKNWSGIIAICLTILKIAFDLWERRTKRKQAIADDFWLRKVGFEHCIKPLFEAIETLSEGCRKEQEPICSALAEDIFERVQKTVLSHSSRLAVLNVASSGLRTEIDAHLIRLEEFAADFLTDHPAADPQSQTPIILNHDAVSIEQLASACTLAIERIAESLRNAQSSI